jgi:hypothetical protein
MMPMSMHATTWSFPRSIKRFWKLFAGILVVYLIGWFCSFNNYLFSSDASTTNADYKVQSVALVAMKNATANANTTKQQRLFFEVEQISHESADNKIVVQFRSSASSERQCRNPRLFGRLSGPYVTLIQWETTETWETKITETHINITNETANARSTSEALAVDQIIGHYTVPFPGRYFVEVIGLFCNDLEWNADYRKVCLEDPNFHRMTDDAAFIDVKAAAAAAALPQRPTLGYWKWSQDQRNDSDSDDQQEQHLPVPLFTRYQPQKCRTAKSKSGAHCNGPMSLERFSPYEFVYNDVNEEEMVHAKANLLEHRGGATLLCFVGFSHSREMTREVNVWLQQWNISNSTRAIWIPEHFPRMIKPPKIRDYHCNETVIAVGQWSAGRNFGTRFPQYQKEVTNMILRLKQSGLNMNGIHLRNIHYNALGDEKTICPPFDWRSPPVIERYNDIIQNLTSSMNVSYIDTNSIIGPLWDISRDFSHYRLDIAAKAEALYLLGRLLPKPE